MKNQGLNVGYVSSIKKSAQIEISGFERVDEATHMIEWLGKGKDFRQFIVNDIEEELYAQDSNSQLLSANCTAKPEYETKLLHQNDVSQKGILTQFSITFPVVLRVNAGNGVVWELDVKHNYLASDLDIPGAHKLRLNFTIVSHAPVDLTRN